MTKEELKDQCDILLKVARNCTTKHIEFPLIVSIHHPNPGIGWMEPDIPIDVLNADRAKLWWSMQALIKLLGVDGVIFVSDTFMTKVNHEKLKADGLTWDDLKSVKDAVDRGYGKREEALVVMGQMDGAIYGGLQLYERQGDGIVFGKLKAGFEGDSDYSMVGGNLGRPFQWQSPGSNFGASSNATS